MFFFLSSITPSDIQQALKERFEQDELLNHPFFKSCLQDKNPEPCYQKTLKSLSKEQLKSLIPLSNRFTFLKNDKNDKKKIDFLKQRIQEGLLGKGFNLNQTPLKLEIARLAQALGKRSLFLNIGSYCLSEERTLFTKKDKYYLLNEDPEVLKEKFEQCLKSIKYNCPKKSSACVVQKSIDEYIQGTKKLDLLVQDLSSQSLRISTEAKEIEQNLENIVNLSSFETIPSEKKTFNSENVLHLRKDLYSSIIESQNKEELQKTAEQLGISISHIEKESETIIKEKLRQKYTEEYNAILQNIEANTILAPTSKELEQQLYHYTNVVSNFFTIEKSTETYKEPLQKEFQDAPPEIQPYIKNLAGKNINSFMSPSTNSIVTLPLSFIDALRKNN